MIVLCNCISKLHHQSFHHVTIHIYKEIQNTLKGHKKITCIIVNPIALRKAEIACNFGLSECCRVKEFA